MAIGAQERLYVGVDVGTTGTKATVVDGFGVPHGRGQASYRLESPRRGHYVQDAREWRDGTAAAIRAACVSIDADRVVAIAVSAQGGTLVPVDELNVPLAPARSWLDRRATGSAATFEHVFGLDDFYRRTGWPIAPNNTAAQLLDLASANPGEFAAAACFCDTASYLNAWLTGTHTIDANVAGISQLTDAETGAWDEEILAVIGVRPARLPAIAAPGSPIGTLTEAAAEELGLRPGIAVGAGAQDQYCAALGAGAIAPGDVLLSTGTAWVMLAAASEAYGDPTAGIGSGRHLVPGLWGHFGEISNGGVSIEWVRHLLAHADQEPFRLEELDGVLAGTPAGAEGLSFFPFFDGTSLFDDSEASRGSLLGLSLGHDHRHLLRAVAEGVAFATRILLDGYRASVGAPSGGPPIVVGGATRSRAWMQLTANVLASDLLVSSDPDAACIGAAILAATAAGDAPDARSGAERMQCPVVEVTAEAAASGRYESLFSAYRRDAHALGQLYAARQPGEGASVGTGG